MKSEQRDGMQIDWDAPIAMDDGVVLRADVSGFNRPEPTPEISLQELTRDVVEAQHAGDASNALLSATQRGYDAGPMVRLQELLETSSQFASALETVQGRQVAARLSALEADSVIRERTGGVRSIFRVHEEDGATRSSASGCRY